MASGKTSPSLHLDSNIKNKQVISLGNPSKPTQKPTNQALVPITTCAIHSTANQQQANTKPKPKPQPKVRAYEDEEADSDEENGPSAGLREVSKRTARHNVTEAPPGTIPLRTADVALKQTMQVAVTKNADALAYIDERVERARSQGLFTIEFTFGEVEGLGAASHREYVAFVQLLSILGYTAKYSNGEKPEPATKEIFQPSTRIFLEWIPKK